MNFYFQRIADLLGQLEILVEQESLKVQHKALSPEKTDFLNDAFGQLEGKGDLNQLPALGIEFIKVNDSKLFVLDFDPVSFNRYRRKTLLSSFYEQFQGFELVKYKNYCGKHEKEALKSGTRNDIWTSEVAEELFGESVEQGEFYGNGSAGWKLLALQSFHRDLYLSARSESLIYLSMYDTLMISGKITSFKDLLRSNVEGTVELVKKVLLRKVMP